MKREHFLLCVLKIQHFRTATINVNSLGDHALRLHNKLKSRQSIFFFLLQGFKKKLTLLFRIADLRIIILARSSYKCAISMAFSKVTLLWSVSWAKST